MMFCFKLKTADEMRVSDWSSDVCSADLPGPFRPGPQLDARAEAGRPGLPRQPGHQYPRPHAVLQLPQPRELDRHLDQGRLARFGLRLPLGLAAELGRDRTHRSVHHLERQRPEEDHRSEEHTSELQSLMRLSYAVFCLNK